MLLEYHSIQQQNGDTSLQPSLMLTLTLNLSLTESWAKGSPGHCPDLRKRERVAAASHTLQRGSRRGRLSHSSFLPVHRPVEAASLHPVLGTGEEVAEWHVLGFS